MSINGNLGSAAERNRVLNMIQAGDYHDTYPQQDSISRKNYFYNFRTGIYHNLVLAEDLNQDPAFLPTRNGTVSQIVTNGSTKTVTVFCGTSLDAVTEFGNDYVFRIYYAGIKSPYVIARVIRLPRNDHNYSTVFTFTTDAALPFSASDPVTFLAFAQQVRAVVEDNIFEAEIRQSIFFIPPGPIYIQAGNDLYSDFPGSDLRLFSIIEDLIVRGNFIRPRDNLPMITPEMGTIGTVSCRRLMVCDNLLPMQPVSLNGFQVFSGGSVEHLYTFNNQMFNGTPMKWWDSSALKYIIEFEDEVDDWLMGF